MLSKIPPEGSLVVDDSVSLFSSEFAAILHHVLITPNRVRITLKSQLFYFTRDFEFALKARNKLHWVCEIKILRKRALKLLLFQAWSLSKVKSDQTTMPKHLDIAMKGSKFGSTQEAREVIFLLYLFSVY